jgi:hypothetical protein
MLTGLCRLKQADLHDTRFLQTVKAGRNQYLFRKGDRPVESAQRGITSCYAAKSL